MADHEQRPEQPAETGTGQDPWWPEGDEHPITELMAPTQGSPSPFGEAQFPLPADQLDYEHPVTEINR